MNFRFKKKAELHAAKNLLLNAINTIKNTCTSVKMQNKLIETHWNVYSNQFIAVTRDTTTSGLRGVLSTHD